MLKYLWRLARPYVYSVGDYYALTERNPMDLTYREIERNMRVHSLIGEDE